MHTGFYWFHKLHSTRCNAKWPYLSDETWTSGKKTHEDVIIWLCAKHWLCTKHRIALYCLTIDGAHFTTTMSGIGPFRSNRSISVSDGFLALIFSTASV